MQDLTNPAKRVLNLVQQVKSQSDQQPMSEAWGKVFGLKIELVKEDPHQVYEKLRFLRSELDLFEERMQETEFSNSLYEPYIQRVRNTISVNNLAASWSNYKHNLTSDTVLALKYCAEIIPSEPSVDQKEFERILSAINDLKQEIANGNLSRGMYKILISQITIIENAIQSYPVIGGVAIKKAFSEGFADLVENAESISSTNETDKSTASKIAKIWNSMKEAGNEFVETDRIASAYVGLIEKGQATSDTVIGWLNNS